MLCDLSLQSKNKLTSLLFQNYIVLKNKLINLVTFFI
jgi:hypothetical protein